MYIFTDEHNVIFKISAEVHTGKDGNYFFVEDPIYTVLKKEYFNYYEAENIPDEISARSYCYSTELGFYTNPNWNPYNIPNERYKEIEQSIVDGIVEGAKGK